MKNKLLEIFKKKSKKNNEEIIPKSAYLTLDEFLDVLFLVLPYLRVMKRIKSDYNSQSDGNMFRFVVSGLISEMEKKDLYKAFSILLRKPEAEIEKMTIVELVSHIPDIIGNNDLLELYAVSKHIGVIE